MNKKHFLVASIIALAGNAFAGGYLTNTNQSIYFLRNPARDAAIGIDGVYFNPAGAAFYNDGFHIQFNWQNAHQKRDAYASYPIPVLPSPLFKYNFGNPSPNEDGGREFTGRVDVPIQPSLFALYNTGDWSFQFGFGVIGGGGNCEFENGVGMFEALVGSKALTALGQKFGGYSLDSYVNGKQYYFGGTFAVARKLSEKLSVSLGLRGIYVTNNFKGHIKDMKFGMLTGIQENPLVVIDQTQNPALSDLELDCDQKGFGIAPIIGIDWQAADWVNIAAKFEFKTKLRVESEAHNNDAFNALAGTEPKFAGYLDGAKTPCDMPAIATIGAQFMPTEALRLNVGYHHYFDMDTKQWTKDMVGNTNEILFGAEYAFSEMFEVSAGFQKTMPDQTDLNLSDMAFSLSSYSYGLGVGVRLSPSIKLNVAYFRTVYDDYTKTDPEKYSVTTYSRTNYVIGAGIDISF